MLLKTIHRPPRFPKIIIGSVAGNLGGGGSCLGGLIVYLLDPAEAEELSFFLWGPRIIFYSLIFHRPQCFAPSGGALPSYWGGCRLALQRGGRRPAVGAGGGGGQAGSHRGPATRDNGRLQHSVGQVPDEGRSHPVAGWRGSIGVVCVAP